MKLRSDARVISIAPPLEWIQNWRKQRVELEARIGSMTLVLAAPVMGQSEWWWGIYYDSHQIHYGWGATRQEAEARAIDRAREWVAQATIDLVAIARAFEGLEGLEPSDPCLNECGERLLAGSPAGNGRVACDKCQTFWD